jgi:hypothetical protein
MHVNPNVVTDVRVAVLFVPLRGGEAPPKDASKIAALK